MTKKKSLIAIIILALIAAIGWYIVSPLYTLKSIRDAVEAKDAETVTSYVDFPALRKDLKKDLSDLIAQEARKQPGAGALGGLFGGAFVDKMVDQVVTPDGISKVFAMQVGKTGAPSKAGDAKGSGEDFEISRNGLSEFRVQKKPKDGPVVEGKVNKDQTDKQPADEGGLVFQRSGLGWKLVGIDLPKGGL